MSLLPRTTTRTPLARDPRPREPTRAVGGLGRGRLWRCLCRRRARGGGGPQARVSSPGCTLRAKRDSSRCSSSSTMLTRMALPHTLPRLCGPTLIGVPPTPAPPRALITSHRHLSLLRGGARNAPAATRGIVRGVADICGGSCVPISTRVLRDCNDRRGPLLCQTERRPRLTSLSLWTHAIPQFRHSAIPRPFFFCPLPLPPLPSLLASFYRARPKAQQKNEPTTHDKEVRRCGFSSHKGRLTSGRFLNIFRVLP